MTKINSSPERDVENIRRKNVEDNQNFLEKLRMTNIRNDFLNSARLILHKDRSDQVNKNLASQQQKKEYVTRYSEKVKSGEIDSFVPEWQRHIEEKKKEAERKLLDKERRKLEYEQKRQEMKKETERKLLDKERRKLEYKQKRQEKEDKKQEILLNKELKKVENKLIIEERIKMIRAKRLRRGPSKWIALYKNNVNGNPYQRVFKPRHTKIDERIEQNLFKLS